MNPKPDMWILFCDTRGIGDDTTERYRRIGLNYAKTKHLVPDKVDHVFILEDDCTPPDDVLVRLLKDFDELDADCLVTACYQRMLGHNDHLSDDLMVYNIYKEGPIFNLRYPESTSGIQRVDASSFNCLMLKRRLLDIIKFATHTYFMSHDMNFFLQCKLMGVKVYCDFTISTKHNNAKTWEGGTT